MKYYFGFENFGLKENFGLESFKILINQISQNVCNIKWFEVLIQRRHRVGIRQQKNQRAYRR